MFSQIDARHTKGCKKTFHCQICLVELNSEDSRLSHNRGSKHRKKLRELECKESNEMFSHQSDKLSQIDARHTMGCKKTLYCQICLVELNSEDSMFSHNMGSKHRKKLLELKCKGLEAEQPIFPIQNPLPTRKKVPTFLMNKIREFSAPVVGLDYIKEFVPVSNREMEPHYECSLCDSQGQANGMFCHIVGQKHRRNFLDSFQGHAVDSNKLSPAQLSELVMMYDEKENTSGRIATIYSDTSYPWPQGKEPWNVENGGIGIAPDDARRIEELQNQLTIKCKEKTALEADITKYKKRISDKDLETANLDTTVKNLEKGVKDLAAKFAKKCIEKNVLEQDFKKYKENIFTSRLSIRKDIFKQETSLVPKGADTQFSIPSKSSGRSCDPQVNWTDETKQDGRSANLKRKYADR